MKQIAFIVGNCQYYFPYLFVNFEFMEILCKYYFLIYNVYGNTLFSDIGFPICQKKRGPLHEMEKKGLIWIDSQI